MNKEVKIDIGRPPMIEEVLSGELSAHLSRGGKLPRVMPQRTYSAAQWWINHQERPRQYADNPTEVIDRDGNLTGWNTPYHDRLVYNLRVFLSLKPTDQEYIAKQIEHGTPWRGDAMPMYRSIVDQTTAMKKNPQAYKERAAAIAKQFLRSA